MSKTVSTDWYRNTPVRIVKDGVRFRAQWVCAIRNKNWIVCGAWYKAQAGARRGLEKRIDKQYEASGIGGGRDVDRGMFRGWRWPAYSTRRKRNPDHRCAVPEPLSAEERDELPNRGFAQPKKRKYPLYQMEGGKMVPSPSHASNAKARATQQYNAGKLSATQRNRIHAAADKVLAKCRADNPDDFARDWKLLKRAPVNLDGRDVGEFGRALDVEAGGLRLTFKPRLPFYWEPRSKSLVIFQGGGRTKNRVPGDVDPATERAFRAFMGRNPDREYQRTMPPVSGGVWRKANAERFDYWSDKFGDPENYTHGFTSNVSLYRGGGSKPPWIWVLRGGRLRVTKRGIEG